MEGFFVTVDCSKMLNFSNDLCYKIFIDKSEMSIVYELKEWIRFMFGLESCFFLVHDNSVIHELEDIQVLQILRVLELRPCVRANCLHKTMEKNLLNKLNLFVYWKEMKVHKLFLARQNRIIQKIPHNQLNCSNFNESVRNENVNEENDKSGAENTQWSVTSSLIMTNNNEVVKENLTNKNQSDLKEINTSPYDKNFSSDEIKNPNFFQKSNSDNLNLHSESINSQSYLKNKKPKLQLESKKQTTDRKNTRKISIPFSLGALLSDIREKAQNQDLKEKQVTDNVEELGDLVCSDTEDENFATEKGPALNDSFGKRKRRRRKHKRQNLKLDFLPSNESKSLDVPWNFKEVSVCTKPNHIRFSDADEIMETETIDSKSVNLSSFTSLNNEMQEVPSAQLTPEPTPLVEEIEKDMSSIIKHNHEVCGESVNHNGADMNCTDISDSGIEKKQLNESDHNLSVVESLKKKITHPGIFSRFY